jgi:chemotaxis protein CheD
VGIAELAVSKEADAVLSAYALGSCLGVSMYDPVAKVGGLLHVMLPDSRLDPDRATAQPAMFIDTGIPALVKALEGLHAERGRLAVCVAGGAQLMDSTGAFNIGQRNTETLMNALQQLGLRVNAQQTGGQVNRSMFLRLASGEVLLKFSGQPGETVLCANSTST